EAPPQDVLDRAWERHRDLLLAYARRHGRPLHLTEVGYGSAPNAAREPWNPTGQRPDPGLQRRCFLALTRAWADEKDMVRATVWATEDPVQVRNPTGFEPIGKPAESVLADFWTRRLSLGQSPR